MGRDRYRTHDPGYVIPTVLHNPVFRICDVENATGSVEENQFSLTMINLRHYINDAKAMKRPVMLFVICTSSIKCAWQSFCAI